MRKRHRSLALAGALTASAVALAACGQAEQQSTAAHRTAPAAGKVSPAPARPTLERKLEQLVAAGAPGVIAAVDDGHGLSLKAAGLADVRGHRRLRVSDRFRAGSNTKTMVATVALQLEAEHRLSLSDTVEHWLPGVLPYGDQVSLRQLLNMTGGVPDYVPGLEPKMVADNAFRTRAYTPRQLIAMAGEKPDFAPGTAWNYSTTGYILAGLMIERASGNPVGEELDRRIFKPLRMRDTYLPEATTAIRGPHAHGYGELRGALRDVTNFNASAGWAGGGAVTSASDMARYWRALLGGKLLAPAQLKAMKTTVPVAEGYPGSYGLGLFRWTQYAAACGVVWGNGGDLPGFSSEFLNSEDGRRQSGVIINVNPIPKAASGEPLGGVKRTALADALGRDYC
jgi:D-alanyl-D-alanine carboxypeptidase